MADIIDQLMNAIGTSESNNNYTEGNSVSSATGRFQYLDSTWAHYGGYARAKDAPPAVQDQKARADLMNKMHAYGGNVRAVIQSWFYPAGVGKDNLVPPGNKISMGQYADRVMKNMGLPVKTTSGGAGAQTAGPVGGGTFPYQLPQNVVDQLTQAGNRLSTIASMFGGTQDSSIFSLSPQQQQTLPNALGLFGQALNGLMAGQPAADATTPQVANDTGTQVGGQPYSSPDQGVSGPAPATPTPATPTPATPEPIPQYGQGTTRKT